MSFQSEVRTALRESGVPVAHRCHRFGVVVKATSSGDVRLTFHPLVRSFEDELVQEAVDAVCANRWRYTREQRSVIVHRGRRPAAPTPPPARPGRG